VAAHPEGFRSQGQVALRFTLSVPDAAPLPAVPRWSPASLTRWDRGHCLGGPECDLLSHVLDTGDFQLAIASWDAGADPDLTPFWSSTSTRRTGTTSRAVPPIRSWTRTWPPSPP